jgi:CDP-diacylglycerol--inositol 3-phosphatidyltransferase
VFALYAFAIALKSPAQCISFYFLSFVCDELDGRFARMLNQTSTLGAVLDMVTDR